MLQLSKIILNRPVLSLRTGGQVAMAIEPIINPVNLKIEAWWCEDSFDKKQLILVAQDVRDILKEGIVVNDYEVLADPEDLIRLKKLLELDFQLINKPVVTVNRKHLGKVEDYAIETSSLFIQKIYVAQSILRNFSGGSLAVDRNQIIEITDKKIVVQNPLQPRKVTSPVPMPAS